MSVNPRPSPEPAKVALYREEWDKLEKDLISLGFSKTTPGKDGLAAWQGPVPVEWTENGSTVHKETVTVKIELRAGFPLERPYVYPVDTKITNARHQAPQNLGGWLCLWSEEVEGWRPGSTAAEILERTAAWYRCFKSDKWSSADRPPDLHLYYEMDSPVKSMMITGDDWTFPDGIQSGRFRIHGSRGGRSIATRIESNLETMPHLELIASDQFTDNGIWFRLHREPFPKQTWDELLPEIDDAAKKEVGWAVQLLKGVLGDKIRDQGPMLILGIGYPKPQGGEAWLFLRADFTAVGRTGNGRWNKPEILRAVPLKSYESAPADKVSMLNRTSHTADALGDHRVLIFGVGAIGSSIAVLLAKCGVGQLDLADRDTLRPGNCVRHECGLVFVGANKAVATKGCIALHAPYCRVSEAESTWDPARLRKAVAQANVIIDATANPNFSSLLNEVCLSTRTPIIFVASHREAAVGRIRVVRPGQGDACHVCYEGQNGFVETRGMYPTIPIGPEREFIEAGCGSPTTLASALDLEAIANHAARTTIQLLEKRLNCGNHCLVVNTVLPEGSEPLRSIGAHWSTWNQLPGCGACSVRIESVQKKSTTDLTPS
ncbi:MAG: hypothetical protein A2992_06260 [Elusimicrobia bacterium RIFCSPLOWO2_01_FULL_59_12]|nr:MAG: hypothetical protein A2992_06260 [Elusimicrobia bacterium RIFCSPLOWO2_01_FULL_59_12]